MSIFISYIACLIHDIFKFSVQIHYNSTTDTKYTLYYAWYQIDYKYILHAGISTKITYLNLFWLKNRNTAENSISVWVTISHDIVHNLTNTYPHFKHQNHSYLSPSNMCPNNNVVYLTDILKHTQTYGVPLIQYLVVYQIIHREQILFMYFTTYMECKIYLRKI